MQDIIYTISFYITYISTLTNEAKHFMTGFEFFFIMRQIYVAPYKVYEVLWQIQQPLPEISRQTPFLSNKCSILRITHLHNTRDLWLYVPSEGRSNNC